MPNVLSYQRISGDFMPLSPCWKGILLSLLRLLESFTWLGTSDPKDKFHQIILKVLSKDDKKCFSPILLV